MKLDLLMIEIYFLNLNDLNGNNSLNSFENTMIYNDNKDLISNKAYKEIRK